MVLCTLIFPKVGGAIRDDKESGERDREQAKRIILEILRQARDGLGKTLVFKTFWLAHLYYSKLAPSYLSAWPIVRMPNGPGIDKGDRLLYELTHSGAITQDHVPKRPYMEIVCRLTNKPDHGDLSLEATEAIRHAVQYVETHSASSISELSHDFSRSWNSTPNGGELDIYSDLIPDDEYEEIQQQLQQMKKVYEDIIG